MNDHSDDHPHDAHDAKNDHALGATRMASSIPRLRAEALPMAAETRAAVTAARRYDEAMVEYPGFMASRRNYDVGQGLDTDGRPRLGVLESSWRIGGASSAELVALAAFAKDPVVADRPRLPYPGVWQQT
jgi:hypothetical protein